ncbi:MAG: Nif3-like dinuclear metal center hexameric protein [Deltaproteobacteria bacterium]|nr:Nif3-like dinuclear metal center hexameric protein [Deltaproteobacteria bacterium]
MVKLSAITGYLNNLLSPQLFKDVAMNGLQVEGGSGEVSKVAVAVDSGLSIIEKAAACGAKLLLVHHGLFWGSPLPITGTLGRKVEILQKAGCSLYASHLPLDAHLQVGNGAELGRFLGLSNLEGFCEYSGSLIGARGECEGRSLDSFVAQAKSLIGGKEPLVLPFGNSTIRTVGIVTGSGAFGVKAAAEAGLDLYFSGEPKHEVYHLTKELRINAIFAGHYATETFGVRALARCLEKEFNLQTVFIDETSGI